MKSHIWEVSDQGYVFSHIDDLPDDIQKYLIKNELEYLYLDDNAEYCNGCYVVPHEKAAAFSKKERELLDLPDIFPYCMTLKSHSDMGHADFQYVISFSTPKDSIFLSPKIIGSYIEFHAELQFMFNSMQYKIVTLVQECNTHIQQVQSRDLAVFNYEHFAEIKKYAEQVRMTMDSYLANLNVIVPEKMTVSIEKNEDGTYGITPVFLTEKDKSFSEICDHKLYDSVNKRARVKSSYVGENNTKYIIKKELQEGIQQVKTYKHANEETARNIVAAPQEIFNSEAFFFDVSYYADRVNGIGEYLRKNLPYIKMTAGNWLPEEGSTQENQYLETLPPHIIPERVAEIRKKVCEAQNNNEDYIVVDGQHYRITNQLLEQIYHATDPLEAEHDDKEKKKQEVLQIKDNLEEEDYVAENKRKSCLSVPLHEFDVCNALNSDITLYKHQQEGLQWMQSCWTKAYKGVLLADDMGLGKTVQAYAFIAALKCCYKGDMPSVLIVAPVSLLRNWYEEYNKFVRSGIFNDIIELYEHKVQPFKDDNGLLKTTMFSYNSIVLTTYETLRRHQLSLGRVAWSVMILDEAQKIKNPTTMTTMAVKAMNYEFGIALTGTPVENTWVDLWSIMDFVSPGKLSSLREFCQLYQHPLEKIKDDINAVSKLGSQLKQALDPLFLRRLKTDYLEGLPKKEIIKLERSMPEVQQHEYEQVIQDALQAKKNLNATSHILQTIAKLRDISLCPNLNRFSDVALLKSVGNDIIQSSARLQVTFDILEDIYKRKEKVLIFITSRKMQVVLKYLIEEKYDIHVFGPINGETISGRRQAIVHQFNKFDGFSVLLLSVEAGGVGFNITSANNVIHLSRCWNPAKEDQATDRVYRIGQKKDVHVYIPLAYDPQYKECSFDERLDQLLEHKRGLSKSVLYPTGDSEGDGIAIFNEILQDMPHSTHGKDAQSYFTIQDMDDLDGSYFERVICLLYNQMPNYYAEKTKASYDYGADVVVSAETSNLQNLLIQCKQTSANKNMDGHGVEEVHSAIAYYEKLYAKKFTGVVVTNAPAFTESAKKRAELNGIQLICRNELEQMLQQYPVSKFSS